MREMGGKNRQRQRLKVSRLHQRIKNLRADFINNQTTRLLQHNKIICVEDLKSANMFKNHRLAKSITDASWYEFKRQLLYKARWQNKTVVVIDPFYPSSQLCSSCGFKNEKLKDLKIRSWECPECGVYHPNRDLNAAINIKKEGLRTLSA